jgi:hypothetical protein
MNNKDTNKGCCDACKEQHEGQELGREYPNCLKYCHSPKTEDWEVRFVEVCDDAAYFNDGLLDGDSRERIKSFIAKEKQASFLEALRLVEEEMDNNAQANVYEVIARLKISELKKNV